MVSYTKLAIAIALVCCVAYVHSSPLLGGVDDEKPIDEEIEKVIASVESSIRGKFPAGYTELKPLSYKTQIVSGKNYFVKAIMTDKNGKKSPVHLRIYHPFRGANELTAIKTDVDEKSPLKYFQ